MFYTDSITEPKRKNRFLVRFNSVIDGITDLPSDQEGITVLGAVYKSLTPHSRFFENSDFTFYVKSVTKPSLNFAAESNDKEGGFTYTTEGFIIKPTINYESIAKAWSDIELKLVDLGNGTKGDLEDNLDRIVRALGIHNSKINPNITRYSPFCRVMKIWEYEPIGAQANLSFVKDLNSSGYGKGQLSYKDLDFAKQANPNGSNINGEVNLFDDIDRTIINRLEGKKALWQVYDPYLIGITYGNSDYSSDDINEITLKFKPTYCEHYVYDRAQFKSA